MTTGPYRVVEVWAEDDVLVTCGNCEWIGTAGGTTDIEVCSLTAGDPSPVGRCPECECLCYVEEQPAMTATMTEPP
jgi:hypothetical protein